MRTLDRLSQKNAALLVCAIGFVFSLLGTAEEGVSEESGSRFAKSMVPSPGLLELGKATP